MSRGLFLFWVLAYDKAAVLRDARCEGLNIEIPNFFYNWASEWISNNTPVLPTIELADKYTDLYILCIFAKTFCRRNYLKAYLDLWKIWLRTRITFTSIPIKFRWGAFFHLHFWQLFFFIFHFILHVKSSIFHQLSNAIKIISTRVQAKSLWAKL